MSSNPLDLQLRAGTLHPTPDLHPNRLLDPAFEAVPFEGRPDELAKLDDWLALPEKVAVRVVHGPRGVGKTRFVQQWLGTLRDAGLEAGFLAGPLHAEQARAIVARAPCIVAIDEAERRPGLEDFLDALATFTPDKPVRVLLLAPHIGDWWIALTDRDAPLTALLERLTATARLEPLGDPAVRRHELNRAAGAFAELLNHKVPAKLSLPQEPEFDRYLYIHMVALAAVLELELNEDGVVAALFENEERGWVRRAGLQSAPPRKRRRWLERIRYLAAAVVLRGGVKDREALHRLATALDVHKTAELTVEDIPPRVGGFLGPLTPEPLADLLVARALQGADHATVEEMLHGADDDVLMNAFRALAGAESVDAGAVEPTERALLSTAYPARIFPAVAALRARGSGARLATAVAEILSNQGGLDEANALPPLSPRGSLVLADVALWCAETRIVSELPEHELADTMNHYGEWLAALGRRGEALALAKEALDPLRIAARDEPKVAVELARSLRNLGRNLTALGQRAEALPLLQEAATILRKLAETQPFRHRLELAATLRATAHSLSVFRQFDAAVDPAREAVEILRELSRQRPDRALPELARALATLGRVYSREGRHDPALAATQESVDLLRQLVLVQPDLTQPLLAITLNNLASTLTLLGHQRRALRAATEAVERFHRLARVQPDPINLARTCGVLGRILVDDAARAAAAFEDGLRALMPSYHADARAHGELRDALARDYTRACQALKRTPDAELLEITDPG